MAFFGKALLVLLLPAACAANGLRSLADASAEASTSAGKCTAADAELINQLGGGNADGTFPKYLATCGTNNYNIFSGFNSGNFQSCVSSDTGISSGCSSCFAIAAQYGADNCKWSCFFGSWCGSSCLDCVSGQNSAVQECAGITVPSTTSCR
mmetsp:Transcript_101963/g.181106  ORF Transcript_101963/g.181106 Transcript_101963/m.181106 type:complete len:152 (+) Transcript_101963:69-524(+)